MLIPESFLRRLYVKGSLINLDENNDGEIDSFSFKLRNVIGTGTIRGISKISVDDSDISLKDVEIIYKGRKYKISNTELDSSIVLSLGDEVTVVVKKEGGLKPGDHKIKITVDTLEIGKISFDFKDYIK